MPLEQSILVRKLLQYTLMSASKPAGPPLVVNHAELIDRLPLLSPNGVRAFRSFCKLFFGKKEAPRAFLSSQIFSEPWWAEKLNEFQLRSAKCPSMHFNGSVRMRFVLALGEGS